MTAHIPPERQLYTLGFLVLVIGAFLVVFAMNNGCASASPTVVKAPVETSKPCKLPPMPGKPYMVAHGPSAGCPPPFVLCLDVINATKLLKYMVALNKWMNTVVATCADKPPPIIMPPPPPPPPKETFIGVAR